MAEYTIDAQIYRDGKHIGSAYGSGSYLSVAVYDVHSDLANFDEPFLDPTSPNTEEAARG